MPQPIGGLIGVYATIFYSKGIKILQELLLCEELPINLTSGLPFLHFRTDNLAPSK